MGFPNLKLKKVYELVQQSNSERNCLTRLGPNTAKLMSVESKNPTQTMNTDKYAGRTPGDYIVVLRGSEAFIGSGRGLIADMCRNECEDEEKKAECDANARLFADAPKLLRERDEARADAKAARADVKALREVVEGFSQAMFTAKCSNGWTQPFASKTSDGGICSSGQEWLSSVGLIDAGTKAQAALAQTEVRS